MQVQSASNSMLNVSSAEAPAVTRPPPAQPKKGSTAAERAAEPFAPSLDAAPEVRPEIVARGHELYQEVPYPPTEIVSGISRLIARHWEGT